MSKLEFSQCIQDENDKGKSKSSSREGNDLNKDCINDFAENNPTFADKVLIVFRILVLNTKLSLNSDNTCDNVVVGLKISSTGPL